MCGICGIINLNGHQVQEQSIRKMMQRQKHRGPDDEGILIDNNVGLGFVRLSIIDLSMAGHQPMFSVDNRYCIIFNGEVYNYIEIRDDLKKKGYNFLSSTDSEVVLYSYIEWGDACLYKFNGMFAFAIYDKQEKTFFASRDRYGVKPFYYSLNKNFFIFSSEIPSLLESIPQKAEAEYQAIYDFLVFNRTNQTEITFFKDVKKLQHGHSLKIDIKEGDIHIYRWYDLQARLNEPFHSPEEFLQTFSSSCSLRLRSDVPLGVCLSGGLDSSSVLSVLLKDHNQYDINTFSAVYGKNELGDESRFINLYRNSLKNMHFIRPDADSLAEDLDDFMLTHAEPMPTTSVYAQYKVCELAKKNVTVALDGQGADEYLAGYLYFYGFYFKELLKKGRLPRLFSESYHYLVKQKSLFGLKTVLFFLMPESMRTNLLSVKYGYILPQFSRKYSSTNAISDNLYGSSSLKDALLNHFEYKMEHNLLWNDKNSMKFSLEMREPLLDYRLVERTLATNMDMIINKGYTKAILRDAMKGYLPEEIRLRRDKIGFSTPEDNWFRTSYFRKFIKELYNDKRFKSRGIIDYMIANKILENHLNKKINASREIWKLISLELWFRKFID